MATKFEQCYRAVNDAFTERLAAAFRAKFQRELEITCDFLGSMQYVSRPADGRSFTAAQHAWVSAYSAGYADAQDNVWRLANPAA